jgi:hypothetical protein
VSPQENGALRAFNSLTQKAQEYVVRRGIGKYDVLVHRVAAMPAAEQLSELQRVADEVQREATLRVADTLFRELRNIWLNGVPDGRQKFLEWLEQRGEILAVTRRAS